MQGVGAVKRGTKPLVAILAVATPSTPPRWSCCRSSRRCPERGWTEGPFLSAG